MKNACKLGHFGKTAGTLLLAFLAGVVFMSSLRAQSLPTRLGDLDADGRPTVLDLVRLIGHINGTNLLSTTLRPYGDLNEDGTINTNDIALLESAILGQSALPNPYSPPVVTAPVNATNGTNILITGVARPNRVIIVQGGAGLFTAVTDSNGNFSVLVTLQSNRVNYLFLTASNGTFTAGIPQPLRIIQDSEPPSLYLDFPTNGQTLHTTNTVIAGRVGDMLSGFMGLNVWVHSSPAEGSPPSPLLPFPSNLLANVNVGIGNNGSFERGLVPLSEGTNLITVRAGDVHGNYVIREMRVIRRPVSGPRLFALSGDMQMTNMGRRLAQPIVVRVTQADGTTPFANKLLDLQVTRSDGRLLPVDTNAAANPAALTNDITRTPNGVMHLQLFTDANGEARAWWTLGGAAGRGNNRVCVTSTGISNSLFFCASAAPGPIHQINIGTGNNQKAETGAFVTEPLRAWVSDSCNGIEGVPVTFRIVQGAGRLFSLAPIGGEGQGEGAGTNQLTILSSRTGHAEVQLQLGPDAGQHLIEANYLGNPMLPATFIAYGVARDPARPTTFSGLVLDNTSQPIGHAHCELAVGGQTLTTFSDNQGRFTFTNTPAGHGHLHVDGLTATNLGTNVIAPGTFPALAFAFTLVPNAENSLPTPVLLPCMNTNNARTYYGTNDLVLTCEGIEGLKMTIQAGSMRKPNGSFVTPANPAVVSLNQVHHDNVPMPMPDGASPPFAWTLQPGGAHFDPPITIEYPNMSGLPAGGIAYFLSYNHDTERFEIIASGHVTDDSSTIVTDPEAGLSIAGWGGNCPPYSVTGDAERCDKSDGGLRGANETKAECQECQKCQDGTVPEGASQWDILVSRDDARITGLRHSLMKGDCGSTQPGDPIRRYDPKGNPDLKDGPFFGAFCDKQAGVWRLRVLRATYSFLYGEYIPLSTLSLGDIEVLPDCSAVAEVRQILAARRNGCPGRRVGNISISHERVHLDHWISFFRANGAAYLADLNAITIGIRDACTSEEAKALLLATPDYYQVLTRWGTEIRAFGDAEADHLNRPQDFRDNFQIAVELAEFETALESRAMALGCLPQLNAARVAGDAWVQAPHDPYDPYIPEPIFRSIPALFADTWSFAASGQQIVAPAGSFLSVPNISAPDQFGPGGPGSRPDFVSDDYVRVLGVSTKGGTNRYAKSEYFQIRQGQTVFINNLEFGDVPPRKPESLTIVCTNRILRVGEPRQLEVLARFAADAATTNVAPRASWTSYRVSNPAIAIVSPDGQVTPLAPGVIYITAVNEGASAVCGLNVVAGTNDLTTLTGTVVDTNGVPVAGATIYIYDLVLNPITTGPDGHFSVVDVPASLGPLRISVRATLNGRPVRAFLVVNAVSGGTTVLGSIVVSPEPPAGTHVAAGGSHTVALREDSTLWTWGRNDYGQLGNGTNGFGTEMDTPQPILANVTWRAVAAGWAHTVALRKDGTLWAWGDNEAGQLGDGTFTDANTPQPIQTNVTWQAVAAGAGHTVALREDGTLWAWGYNEYGQVGNGTLTPFPGGVATPQPIQTNWIWRAVAAGWAHTLALREDGTLWAWGRNDYGQLGNGTTNDANTPQPISTNVTWRAAAAGGAHIVALRENGTLWAWGANYSGQLGNGTFTSTNTPQPILTNVTWRAVAAGGDYFGSHTVALREDGTLWTWGRNDGGQLGNGTNGFGTEVHTPQQILTNWIWGAVAAGWDHTVASREDGTLWAWGYNVDGQLGNGTFDLANTPQPIQTNMTWQAVAAGWAHTVTLREDGTLWAWGYNEYGQLGNGTFTPFPRGVATPQPIQTNWIWRAVTAGGEHTVALRDDATLWAWGYNGSGQLGNGTTNNANTPQLIQTNVTWRAVAAGGGHTVALREDGTLWAWGDNGSGQLGNGRFTSTNMPQPIQTNWTWRAVAAGGGHTVALRDDSTLWAWGYNGWGQLGNGTTNNANTPQPIQTNMTWWAVAAVGGHTVALRENGTLWAWGANYSGQLGNGTFANTNTPQPILTNVTWRAVAAGGGHTVALRDDATLWAWGNNGLGQLGNGTFSMANTPQPVETNVMWRAVAAGGYHTVALREDGTLWAWGDNSLGQIAQPAPWLPYPVLGGAVWGAPR